MIKRKRAFDLIVSLVALLILSPLLLLITVLIWIFDTKNSPLFVQARYTKGMKVFKIIKFRTMKDGKVTFIGHYLRKYCLDELLQLINVLKGEMSIVGPRAHCIQEAGEFLNICEAYGRRYIVHAGITGPCQVRRLAPNKTDCDIELVASLDAEYAQSVRLRTDLLIILQTLQIFVLGQKY